MMVRFEHRGRTLRAEFRSGGALVGEDDGLENGVLEDGVVVVEIREADIPDDVSVEEGGVEVEGGVSRLEGIGMDEVSDGTGESKEPVMLTMLNEKAR